MLELEGSCLTLQISLAGQTLLLAEIQSFLVSLYSTAYASRGSPPVSVGATNRKRMVVAVDPIKDNLALIQQSVTKAGNQNYVKYVARPVRYTTFI